MNTLPSVAFGAVALTAASLGFAGPASARSAVGVYVGDYGVGVALNPDYCSDYRYRRDHWDYCARFDGYDDDYYDGPYVDGFFFGTGGHHHRHHSAYHHSGFDNHWSGYGGHRHR